MDPTDSFIKNDMPAQPGGESIISNQQSSGHTTLPLPGRRFYDFHF